MKKRLFLLGTSILLIVFFFACGGDDSDFATRPHGMDSLSSSSVTLSEVEGSSETNVSTGTVTDSRDGQTYKTVTIGTQTWMAENLNYDYKVGGSIYGTYTNTDGGESYGRYYTWAAAIDSAAVFSANASGCGYGKTCTVKTPVRGICPEGWHVPTPVEWFTFYSAIGSSPYAMQAKGYAIWSSATDAYGFSALPAGGYVRGGIIGPGAYFWCATEYSSNSAYYWGLISDDSGRYHYDKYLGFSVRCLKDN